MFIPIDWRGEENAIWPELFAFLIFLIWESPWKQSFVDGPCWQAASPAKCSEIPTGQRIQGKVRWGRMSSHPHWNTSWSLHRRSLCHYHLSVSREKLLEAATGTRLWASSHLLTKGFQDTCCWYIKWTCVDSPLSLRRWGVLHRSSPAALYVRVQTLLKTRKGPPAGSVWTLNCVNSPPLVTLCVSSDDSSVCLCSCSTQRLETRL